MPALRTSTRGSPARSLQTQEGASLISHLVSVLLSGPPRRSRACTTACSGGRSYEAVTRWAATLLHTAVLCLLCTAVLCCCRPGMGPLGSAGLAMRRVRAVCAALRWAVGVVPSHGAGRYTHHLHDSNNGRSAWEACCRGRERHSNSSCSSCCCRSRISECATRNPPGAPRELAAACAGMPQHLGARVLWSQF